MLDVEGWLNHPLTRRLRHAATHPGGHLGQGVADVDLPAGDVVLATIEAPFDLVRPGERVLGSGIRPRSLGAVGG